MTLKEFCKINDAARRGVSKQRGWHQRGYTNWMIKDGYFFCLYSCDLTYSWLSVKPMYVDTLWWEMYMPGDKLPVGLRADGAFVVSGETVQKTDVLPDKKTQEYPQGYLEETWNRVFLRTEVAVEKFLGENPDAEKFLVYHKGCDLLYLMTRVHNGMHDEVMDFIAEAFANGYHGFFEHNRKRTYDFILEWYLQHHPEVVPKSLVRQIRGRETTVQKLLDKIFSK